MSNDKQLSSVVVRIFGEEYPITGDDDPAYISRVADMVDTRMKQVAKISRSQARDKVAILAAMSIASELCQKGEDLSVRANEDASRLEDLVARLDDALAGKSHDL